MSKHTVTCDPCKRPMVELYQVLGANGQPPTRVLHCEKCSGVVAVQDVKETPPKGTPKVPGIVPVTAGEAITPPTPAPEQIEIVREALNPEKLRERLTGRGGYFTKK